MRARLVRCAASADVAGGGAAGGAVRCMPGAAAGGAVRCAPGADAGPGAVCAGRGWCAVCDRVLMLPVMLLRAVRCMPGAAGVRPSADAAGDVATGGAVRAGRGWCATGSGRLEKLRIKEAMTRGALPHGGGGRCFFLPGSRRFERPSAACARRGSRVAAFAPAAAGASPRPPLAPWVRVCPGSAARKRFERPSWRGGKRRNPAEKAAAGGLFRRALCACLNKL